MKTIRCAITGAVALSFASAISSFAIEGLQLSVQSSNVVLSWPSVEGETYVVQYRSTLNATDSWQTLTSSWLAAEGTNVTFYIHSNIVQYPLVSDNGTNDGGGGPPPVPEEMSGATADSATTATAEPSVPMAMPANGSGSAVPLAIFPPGFDMSGYIIFDPATGESVSGDGYVINTPLANSVYAGGMGPLDDSGNGTNQYTGFYRVVQNGVHLFGLTNGMILSGNVTFPVEMGLDSTDEIAGVTFYADGAPLIGASADTNAAGGWLLDWDTTMMPNGTYEVSAEVDYAIDDPVTNAPVTVTVSNVISFPNYFTRIFGSQMWVYAETAPNASYQIDMYDEDTNYLGSFVDYADGNGVISFLWDLTDGNGHTFDSTNFYGVFTVTTGLSGPTQNSVQTTNTSLPPFQTLAPAGSGPRPLDASSASATNLWAKEPAWSVGNSWAIAWSPLIVNGSPSTLDIQEMMVGGDGGEYGGVVSTIGFYGLGATMSQGNVSQSSAFEMSDANTRSQFLGYMGQSQYRHFYFFGHGSPSSFGTQGALITYRDVRNTLGNFLKSAKPANYHPYRFVFIDGCQAGQADLCEGFGIPAQTVNDQFFANSHVQSRAFLGFRKDIAFNPNQWTWRALMLGGFFEDWYTPNTTLQTCVNNAVNGTHSSGFQKMDSSWVIYGASDLTRNTDTTQ